MRSEIQKYTLSPLAAEGVGLLRAMQDALDVGILHVAFASGSFTLIKLLRSNGVASELYGILQDICAFLLAFSNISFSHVPRAANAVADSLAKYALNSVVF